MSGRPVSEQIAQQTRLPRPLVLVLEHIDPIALGVALGLVSGAWVFRGTRMPVAAIFDNLQDGLSVDQILELYDGLTREQINAVLDFAAHSLASPSLTR